MNKLQQVINTYIGWQHNTYVGIIIDGRWVGRPGDFRFIIDEWSIENGIYIKFDVNYIGGHSPEVYIGEISDVSIEGDRILVKSSIGYFKYSTLDREWSKPTIVEFRYD